MNIEQEVAAMQVLTVSQLRTRFAEVFGENTRAGNKPWLIKRIAWRLQANAEGGLSERARRRAAELANDGDIRLMPPKPNLSCDAELRSVQKVAFTEPADRRLPPPGSDIRRNYKGQTILVRVLESGFEFEGEVFKSLSAVAKKITGQHCNGFHFFRLKGKGN
jgi:Protein of unknown function (DUF2924)